jgi:hypothetical protein
MLLGVWHWTPNPLIPAAAGLLLAWVLTWLVTMTIVTVRGLR